MRSYNIKFNVEVYRQTTEYCNIPIEAKNRGEAYKKANEFLSGHLNDLKWAYPCISDKGVEEVIEMPDEN